MTDNDPVTVWLNALQTSDEEAAANLWQHSFSGLPRWQGKNSDQIRGLSMTKTTRLRVRFTAFVAVSPMAALMT